jgi:hypothetical protein
MTYRIADLPLRAGAQAGAAVAVRERDAAYLEKHGGETIPTVEMKGDAS